MTVWHSSIERNTWIEKNCRVCFQPDQAQLRVTGRGHGCPILLLSGEGVVPPQWKRRRGAAYGDTYRCSEFQAEPPVSRRVSAPDETLPMFDAPVRDYVPLVEVEGWPRREDFLPARKPAKGEHA